MSFNWKAIESYEDDEVASYRLLGEMLRRRATLDDLDRVRTFLAKAELPSDGWLGLGEALYHTTSGSPAGFDIWLAWLSAFDDVDVDEERLGGKWIEFGEDRSEVSEAVEFDASIEVLPGSPRESSTPTLEDLPSGVDDDEDDDSTNIITPIDSRPPVTGVLAESPRQLLRMVPTGPYILRIFGNEYFRVDEYTVLTLIKRGLFLGAEVKFGDGWIDAWKHPAFEAISLRLQSEAVKILTRSHDEEPPTSPNSTFS